MLAEFRIYVEAVINVWFTGYWFITALPEALSYIVPSFAPESVAARLDLWVSSETRQRFYRAVFLLGIFFAGFVAWDEQYQLATSKAAPAVEAELEQFRQRFWPPLNNQPDQIAKIAAEIRKAGGTHTF